jgi:hypothetical protein
VRLVEALASRPPSTSVRVTCRTSSVTFWWMRLLANRVSDDVPTVALTRASAPPPTNPSVRSQASAATSAGEAPTASSTSTIGPDRSQPTGVIRTDRG